MKEYTSGKESFYDDEKELYFCYVGLKNKERTLFAAVYGNTPNTALNNAEILAEKLNTKEQKSTLKQNADET
jgi:hypothetical protein